MVELGHGRIQASNVKQNILLEKYIFLGWRWVVLAVWGLPYGIAALYDLLHGQEFLPKEYPTLSHIMPSWLPLIWISIGIIMFIGVTL